MATNPLLEVRNLKTYFDVRGGVLKAVDDVSITIAAGETLGLVGESACGKSVTASSVMRLIPIPPGRIAGGEILFEGIDILKTGESEMRQIRGKAISMIFQEPMTSLNPVFPVGKQISDVIRLHKGVSKDEARAQAIGLLEKVGIPEPARRVDDYPHQMSG